MRLTDLLSVSLASLVALPLGRLRSRPRTVSAALSAANPARVESFQQQHAELGTLANDVAARFEGRVRDLENAVLEANERAHAAAEGEAQYRMLMEQIVDGILITDLGGRIVVANVAAVALLGYTAEELADLRQHDVLDLDPDVSAASFQSEGQLPSNREFRQESYVRCKDGSLVPVDVSVTLLGDGSHQLILRDITKRKLAEHQRDAQARDEKLRADVGATLAGDSSLVAILQRSAEALLEHLTGALARIWTVNEVGQLLELQASAGLDTCLGGLECQVPVGTSRIGLLAQTREPYVSNDLSRDPPTGDDEWARQNGIVAFASQPLLAGGRLLGVVALFAREPLHSNILDALALVADILAPAIERKRAEAALRESEARKGAILEAALDCIISMDARGRITEFNPAAERTFGRHRADVLGQELAEIIIPPALRGRHRQGLAGNVAGRTSSVLAKRVEMVAMRANGTEFPVELAIVRSESPGEPSYTGYLRDISEPKQVELALRQSEERYRRQYKGIPIPTYSWRRVGADFVMEECNDAAVVAARDALQWIGSHASDGRAGELDGLDALRICAAEQRSLRREATRSDPLTGQEQTLIKTYVFVPPDVVMVHIEDITERTHAERNREALARSEKLRALGQMASGIAHDLNQSLMLVASYSDLAQQALNHDPPDLGELRELFTTATQAALDGGEAVKRLLLFTRAPREKERHRVDLRNVVRDAVRLTAPRWSDATQAEGRPISLHVEGDGHPFIEGSPARIRELLTNLIFNAVDALPTGGTIRLHVAAEHDQGVVEVTDSGVGMSAEVQARIFEPFFTTKGEAGTGLGLAMVFGIVEQHGGRIEVQSRQGSGTTFRITFPLADALLAEAQPSPRFAVQLEPSRPLRVLAVDDEPMMTKAVVRMLRPSGHLVSVAASGEEALEQLSTRTFDVVVSDMGMGAGINGWELADAIKRRWPAVRFLLATGWGAAIDPTEARAKGVESVLAKPYRLADLEQALAAR